MPGRFWQADAGSGDPACRLHLTRSLREPYRRFPTGCIADFQIGRPSKGRRHQLAVQPAGWETRDTADLEVCATKKPPRPGRCI